MILLSVNTPRGTMPLAVFADETCYEHFLAKQQTLDKARHKIVEYIRTDLAYHPEEPILWNISSPPSLLTQGFRNLK